MTKLPCSTLEGAVKWTDTRTWRTDTSTLEGGWSTGPHMLCKGSSVEDAMMELRFQHFSSPLRDDSGRGPRC